MRFLVNINVVFWSIFLLSGCYCFKEISTSSSIKYLDGTKTTSPLCNPVAGGKSFQLNAYTGFPINLTNEHQYERYYSLSGIYDYSMTYYGQYGLRVEKYFNPGSIRFPVLGIGID